jgi:hypothetical protein
VGHFHGYDEDGERDQGLHRSGRYVHDAQRCQGQGDAVAEGESGYGLKQQAPSVDQQYQAEQKQQMVGTAQDMAKAQNQIVAHSLEINPSVPGL